MKNKLFFLLLFSVIAGITRSQTVTIPDVPAYKFSGVKTEDGRLFYSYYDGQQQKGMLNNIVLEIYGPELTRLNKVTVPSVYGGEIVSVTAHNGGLLFYFKFGKEGALWAFDKDGQKSFDKIFPMDKPYMNVLTIKSMGSNGVLMVRPDKLEKADGFRVEAFDDQMNSKWVQSYFPEKGNLLDKKVVLNGDKIGIITKFWISSFSKTHEEDVFVLQASDGKLLYRKQVGNTENQIILEDIHVDVDGNSLVAGHVIKNINNDNFPTALVVAAFGPDGTQKYNQTHLLAGPLGKKLTPDPALKTYKLGKEPYIHLETILKNDKGYTITGESYYFLKATDKEYGRLPGGIPANPDPAKEAFPPGQMLIMDYVIIDIDNSGAISNARKIGKPYKKIQHVSAMYIDDPEDARQTYSKRNFFSYRFTTERGQPVFASIGWNQNMQYIGFTPLNAKREDIPSRIYTERSVVKPPRQENGEYTSYLYQDGEMTKADDYLNVSGIVPYHQPGKLVFYDINKETLTLKIIEIPKF